MNSSTNDKATGTAKDAIGAAQEKTGDVEGDPDPERHGPPGEAARAEAPQPAGAPNSAKTSPL